MLGSGVCSPVPAELLCELSLQFCIALPERAVLSQKNGLRREIGNGGAAYVLYVRDKIAPGVFDLTTGFTPQLGPAGMVLY